MNATSSNSVNNIAFWYKGSSDSNYTLHENVTSANADGDYVTPTFDQSSDSYDLKINTTSSDSPVTISDVVLDKNTPNPASSKSPTGVISETSPTVSMTATDDLSGVNYSYLNVTDSNGNDIGSTVGTSLSLTDVGSGDFTVNYTIVDQVGNTRKDQWTFTVDTSYDGDSSVSFEYDSGYTYLMEDEGDDLTFDVSLGDSSSEGTDITLKCYAGSISSDNQFDSDGPENVGSDGNTFSCEIPGDEYSDQSVNVVVQACDAAGNCQKVGETTYNMDLSAPFVTNVESSAGVSTFNDNFDMTFEASDSATSVSEMEYFFDDATVNVGEGTAIDGFDDGKFTVDTADLGSGNHTLYIRAKDEAGRWSEPKAYKFEYYPNKSPKVSLSVPDRLEVTAGETGQFDVTVENSGEFLIESVNLNVSSEVLSAGKSISDFPPGETRTFTFETSPSESDIGEYDVRVSTDSPRASKSFTYRIKANQQQRNEVQSNLDKQVQRLEALRANVTSLQEKVSQRRSDQLAANLSEFESSVKTAQTAVENGKYYKAQAALEGIDSDFASAQSSYQNIKQSYEKSRRFKMILAVLGLIILGVLGGVGYLVHEGKVDPEEVMEELQEKLDDLDLGSEDESSGPGLLKKIKLKFEGSESEAEEFEWDGFRDE